MQDSYVSSQFRHYLFAFLLITVTTAALFMLRGLLDTTLIALLYLVPLGIITAMWGLASGVASAILPFFVFNYFSGCPNPNRPRVRRN